MIGRRAWLAARLGLATVALALVAATLSQGLSFQDKATGAGSALPVTQRHDKPAPELRGQTLTAEPFDLQTLRGQVVVVNVLASWCAPCRKELPVLADAAAQWSAHGVHVVGVAMRDDVSDAAQLVRDSGASAVTVVMDPDGTRAVTWGARGVPETYLVDRSGRVRVHAFGPITEEWLQQELSALVQT